MFLSRTSNLLFTDILQTKVEEAQTFRDLRTSRYSSLEDLFKRVEKSSKSRANHTNLVVLPKTIKSEFSSRQKISRRPSEQKTRATSIKLMKQLALQKPDERKERIIKKKGFERQRNEIIQELKISFNNKTEDQKQKLQQMKSQVERVDGILKKLINTQMIVQEDEINQKIKHIQKLQEEESMGLKKKVQSDDQIISKLMENLPQYRKGSMLDPTKYQRLYDLIYKEKLSQMQQNQKVNRNIMYDKSRNQKIPFKVTLFNSQNFKFSNIFLGSSNQMAEEYLIL